MEMEEDEEVVKEVLDFDNVPTFQSPEEGMEYWKGKAEVLKGWCLGLRRKVQIMGEGKVKKESTPIEIMDEGKVKEEESTMVIKVEDQDNNNGGDSDCSLASLEDTATIGERYKMPVTRGSKRAMMKILSSSDSETEEEEELLEIIENEDSNVMKDTEIISIVDLEGGDCRTANEDLKSETSNSYTAKRQKGSDPSSDTASESEFEAEPNKKPKIEDVNDSAAADSESKILVKEEDNEDYGNGWISTNDKKVPVMSIKRHHSSSSESEEEDSESGPCYSKKLPKSRPVKNESQMGLQEALSHKGERDKYILKNIRKIMSENDLLQSTIDAEKEEEDRRKRLEIQRSSNNVNVGNGKITELVLARDADKKPIIQVHKSIVQVLKPHQADGIRFMFDSCFESLEMMQQEGKGGGCILAHCMGLGKTLQTIAFSFTMYDNRKLTGMNRALIVVPLNTVGNWLKEFRQWLRDVDDKNMPRIHCLWDAKGIAQRCEALRSWERLGGFGIINYELFRILVHLVNGTGKGMKKPTPSQLQIIQSALLDPGPDMIVCDEGHLMKNYKSALSETLTQINTKRRVILTGTPLQNNLVEYHTMVNFIKPNLLGSREEFKNRFENPIKSGQSKDASFLDVKRMKDRAHVLHSMLEGCIHRMDFSVLTPYLPPKYEYCIVINLSQKQKDLYRDYLQKKVLPRIMDDSMSMGMWVIYHYATLIKIVAHPMVLAMKKKSGKSDDLMEKNTPKAMNSSELYEEDDDESTLNLEDIDLDLEDAEDGDDDEENEKKDEWWWPHFEMKEDIQDLRLSGKIMVLQEIMKACEAAGDRILIFSQFLTTLNLIERFLAQWDRDTEEKDRAKRPSTFFPMDMPSKIGRWRKDKEYFRIDGSTKTNDRQKYCELFNRTGDSNNAKLFLISTKAGGLGINLFGANRVVIFDASWNPSNDMQSIFRSYRLGQTKPVYIYRLVGQASMEEKIYNRQVVKLALSRRVVDEHQVERHFRYNDIAEFVEFEPDKKTVRPTPPVPKDTLLANLLLSHKHWIDSYFEHDSLLVNKEDETLTEEERKKAWEEYEKELVHPPVYQEEYDPYDPIPRPNSRTPAASSRSRTSRRQRKKKGISLADLPPEITEMLKDVHDLPNRCSIS